MSFKGPVHTWPTEYQEGWLKFVADLQDEFLPADLALWKKQITLRGRGVLQDPSDSETISNWLRINLNQHPERLRLFRKILECNVADDATGSAESKALAQRVLSLIDASAFATLFQ
jgi:hypothetical protein